MRTLNINDPNVIDPKFMGLNKKANALHLDSPLGGSHDPGSLAKETSKRMDKVRMEQQKRLKSLGY